MASLSCAALLQGRKIVLSGEQDGTTQRLALG
jgi:hypothetical protein